MRMYSITINQYKMKETLSGKAKILLIIVYKAVEMKTMPLGLVIQ